MRRELLTTSRKEDRLELLVVRAGLRAGARPRPLQPLASQHPPDSSSSFPPSVPKAGGGFVFAHQPRTSAT